MTKSKQDPSIDVDSDVLSDGPHVELINDLSQIFPSKIHHNIRCDSCGSTPIKGTRYACIKCYELDLCHTCYRKGFHNFHEFQEIICPVLQPISSKFSISTSDSNSIDQFIFESSEKSFIPFPTVFDFTTFPENYIFVKEED